MVLYIYIYACSVCIYVYIYVCSYKCTYVIYVQTQTSMLTLDAHRYVHKYTGRVEICSFCHRIQNDDAPY